MTRYISLILFLLLAVMASAQDIIPPAPVIQEPITATITLAWDPVESADGYTVHCGYSSGIYRDTYPATVPQYSFDATAGPHYCVVSAFNANGSSGYSNEVVATVWPTGDQPQLLTGPQGPAGPVGLQGIQGERGETGPPGPPGTSVLLPSPRIEYPQVSAITTTTATITWATDLECSGTALYGTDSANLKTASANNLGTTDHIVTITGLLARTHYAYKVRSACNGQTIETPIRSFNTK